MNSSTHRNIQHLAHNLKTDDWNWLKNIFDRGTNCGVDCNTVLSTSRSVCQFVTHSHNICSHFGIYFPLVCSEERIWKNSGRLPHDQSAATVKKYGPNHLRIAVRFPGQPRDSYRLPSIQTTTDGPLSLLSSGYPGLFPRR